MIIDEPNYDVEYRTGILASIDWVAGGNFDGYIYKNNKIQNFPTKVILIHIHQFGEYIIKNEFTYEELVCSGNLTQFDYEHLKNTMSIGKGKGSEYEMKIFYEKYKNKN